MKKIYCPHCKKFLFEAGLADIFILCRSCKRVVHIVVISQKQLTCGGFQEIFKVTIKSNEENEKNKD